MIIGLTGRNASGKGEVAEILKHLGFRFHSLSDVIRDEIRAVGQEPTRDRLIAMGRRLRKEHGEGYLATQILSRLEPDQDYVVDSFRHPAEVRVFRDHPLFCLLLVDASPETRFSRIRTRARESDPMTLEEFVRVEEAETSNPNSPGQQLDVCATMADIVVGNEDTIENLRKTVNHELSGLRARR